MAASPNVRRVSIAATAIVLTIAVAILAIRWLPNRFGSLVEQRLARETGLQWRIGDLAVDVFRGLALNDVSIRSVDGLEAHLGSVFVRPPVAVLFGGGGAVRAEAEAASLTLPLDRLPSGSEARRAGTPSRGLAGIQVSLRGAGVAAGERSRTLALSAGTIDAVVDLTDAQTGAGPALQLDLPESGLSIAVAGGAAGTERALTATLAPGDGPTLSATARVLLGDSSLRIDRIAGTVDRAPFTGSLVVDASGTKPRIEAALKLEALALTGPAASLRVDPADGILVPVRIERVPDLAWLAGFEGRAGVTIQRLALGPVRASEVAITARTRDGQLDGALDGAALYGGTARGRYVLAPGDRTPRHEISLTLSGVRIKPLLDAAGLSGLDGAGAARIDVGAQGFTGREILGSAAGQAEMTVTDGRIDGLDLARAAGLTRLGGGLATRLDRLGAHVAIADGRATSNDVRLKTNLIEAEGIGALDLMNGTIDLRLKPVTVAAGGRLDVPIRISGPWNKPSVDADFSGLARDPAGLMEGLTNLGSGLLGGDGAGAPRPEGRPSGRARGGGPPRGTFERGNGLGDLLDGLVGRRDTPRSRP